MDFSRRLPTQNLFLSSLKAADLEYCNPEQVFLRKTAGSQCTDDACLLSAGYAHAGLCEPCACPITPDRPWPHAIQECPQLMKPSEFSLEERYFMHRLTRSARIRSLLNDRKPTKP